MALVLGWGQVRCDVLDIVPPGAFAIDTDLEVTPDRTLADRGRREIAVLIRGEDTGCAMAGQSLPDRFDAKTAFEPSSAPGHFTSTIHNTFDVHDL